MCEPIKKIICKKELLLDYSHLEFRLYSFEPSEACETCEDQCFPEEYPFIEIDGLNNILYSNELSKIINILQELEVEAKAFELKKSVEEIISDQLKEELKGIDKTIHKLGKKWQILKLLTNNKNRLFKEDWGMNRQKETHLHYADNYISISLGYIDNTLNDLRKVKEEIEHKLEIWALHIKNLKIIEEENNSVSAKMLD